MADASEELLTLLRGINEKLTRENGRHTASPPVGGSREAFATAARRPFLVDETRFKWYENTHRGIDWIGKQCPAVSDASSMQY